MGLWNQWRTGRQKRLFDTIGTKCVFRGPSLEVKGHVRIGDRCVLGNNLLFRTHKHGEITIGDDTEIDDYSMMLANSRIEIGDGVYIGPYCVLRDTNHLFQGTDVHWRLTPHLTEPIIINKNCYIAARTYLMPGVTIGENAIVGPASVVTKDIPPNELWAGSPARFIAHRTDLSRKAKFRRDLELAGLFGLSMGEETEEP